ncbi:MAG: ParB N-terminal domain-containing protein, partial [Rhizobiales bacterium]|nr:ParB N-terminal domain-containing protein [Hyphomicrobiales bacterium]
MTDLTITYIAAAALRMNERNARTHSKRQIAQIEASIEAFGFTNHLLIDEANVLIAGHGRLAAARRLALDKVPVIRLVHLSNAEKRALMLADNKIALNAGWDLDLLARELADLSSMDLSLDIDLTGFETAEIDLLIGDDGRPLEAEAVSEPDLDRPFISRPEDIWQLGAHRLMCGNTRDQEAVATLMDGRLADVGFCDPPYNVRIDGHVSGLGKVKHREFTEASGEMTSETFKGFLKQCLSNASAVTRDGAISFVCMDWRHMSELMEAGREAFGTLANLCVWAKTNGGMGSLYRSQHELVFVYRKGDAQHRNNIQLGKFGRNRTNVWTYAGVNTFREGRMDELRAHPTAKPVAMIKEALLDVSRRGDVVLDLFLGSG